MRAFFTLLGPGGVRAARGGGDGHERGVLRGGAGACPQATLVYDLFHVQSPSTAARSIDRVRVDETNRIARAAAAERPEGAGAAPASIKGTRWLLLKNRANVTRRADRVRLCELLAANRALFIVYVLKDDLKRLWTLPLPGAARRCWARLVRRGRWRAGSRRSCGSRGSLATRIDGILSHCRYPLHTGLLEGINNKIKVLKRMAYGFRDDAYFFLKIRAAFPGIP